MPNRWAIDKIGDMDWIMRLRKEDIQQIILKRRWISLNNCIRLGIGVNDVYKATIMVVGALGNGWSTHQWFSFSYSLFVLVWIINRGNDTSSKLPILAFFILFVVLFSIAIQSGLPLRMVIGSSQLWKNLYSPISKLSSKWCMFLANGGQEGDLLLYRKIRF